MKTALITGVTGQDGAYLAEHLLHNNYKVFGTYRRTSSVNMWRLEELGIENHENLELVEFDLTDLGAIVRLIEQSSPDEVYNLAAQSFVGVSFDQPATTAQITGIGALNVLEAIRIVNPKIKFYQASTSEMFGKVHDIPQSEDTIFHPRSPYGVAKLYAHWMTLNYQESYDMFAACGILFNHESPLRGIEFVTRKITHTLAQIKLGKKDMLELGNMDAKRDWGYAKDYVVGMHLMLQHSKPDVFVLATGRTETVRDFVSLSCQALDIGIEWRGEGIDEVAIDQASGKEIVRVNPKFFRPAEVDLLIGDPSKAAKDLGWTAETTLEQLCSLMVDADLKRERGKV
jgi:GDPmannose 4,6-dehydratase